MNRTSVAYRFFIKSFAILLVTGFLLPSGLQAKQLVDFCIVEMNSHDMVDSSRDCSDLEEKKHPESTHDHHDCDGNFICACSVDLAPLSKENGIPISLSFVIVLQSTIDNYPSFSTDEPVQNHLRVRIGQHDAPPWLLYDTLLM